MHITSSATSKTSFAGATAPRSDAGGSFAAFLEFRVNAMYEDAKFNLSVVNTSGAGGFGALIESQLAAMIPAREIASEMTTRFLDLVKAGSDGGILTAATAHSLLTFETSRVVNPIDKLTDSDVRLFHDATGLYLYNGEVLDENGNLSDDPGAGDLIGALYDLRAHGLTGEDGYMHTIDGAVTADDLARLIEPYRNAGSQSYNSSTLDKAIEILTAQANAAHRYVSGAMPIDRPR